MLPRQSQLQRQSAMRWARYRDDLRHRPLSGGCGLFEFILDHPIQLTSLYFSIGCIERKDAIRISSTR
jgi:hypothetical protein